ncbi:E3 ubiquitin-protein ligase RNF180 isoform X2 [Tiliqua scincoides]|uniref:E3 ubiquitin-protein ligase RNF180 isoform X2 n=1 Tax=Tiliqua scincoides TaxID=71010 RepID=UPI003461CF5C
MNSQGQVDMLRCWKCRKYIANLDCLIKDQATDLFEAQWTGGKLNCLFCGARLGGFNFVSNTKCSCGRFTNIHLCKKRTDCQAASSVALAMSPLEHLSLGKVQSDYNKEIQQRLIGGTLGARNQGLSYMAKNNNGIGRLMDALCLEVRSTSLDKNGKKLPNPKTSLSASLAVNDSCTVKAFHRKSQSLDLNVREKLVLLPTLYGTSTTKRPVFSGQHETQPFYTKGCLQLKSNPTHTYFHSPFKSDAGELPKSFSVTSYGVLAQMKTEFIHSLEASRHYLESVTPDQQLFLSSSEITAEEDVGRQQITPLDLLQPMTAIDKKLSKRRRNRLSSMRRKQRWQERRLQKQTMNDNLNTEEERQIRRDKESYLCAVCLDVYFNPYMCYPCHHIFCEPCLRTIAKDNPTSTPCPLCRTTIAHVFFQSELNNFTKAHFPMEYLKLKESFQESSLAKWPLPSCKRAFRVIEGFQRSTDSFTRRHFPHAAHRMDYLDFEDDSRGWRFDMDMVIIYIYSINWVIGFIVLCFLCYFFFPF